MLDLFVRSHGNLQRHLARGVLSDADVSNPDLLRLALFWPYGLKLLIVNGIQVDSLDDRGYSVLDIALRCGLSETVQILLRLQVSLITPHTWNHAGIFQYQASASRDEILEMMFCIAAQISECSRMIRKILVNDTTRPGSEKMYDELYHEIHLTAAGAEALFQNDFREVNRYVENSETPLWYHIRLLRKAGYLIKSLESQLALIQWLHDKNVSLDTPHPRFNNLPSHALVLYTVRNVFENILWEKLRFRMGKFENLEEIEIYLSKAMPEIQSFILRFSTLSDAVHDRSRDRCVCYCSRNGCDVITSTLFKNSFLAWWPDVPRVYITRSKSILSEIFGFVGIHLEENPELRNSALRIMTFEILGMTHTCHLLLLGPDRRLLGEKRLTEEDIANIHDVEEEDIKILEDLLEYFETVWSSHDGTFLEFLETHWEPHMAKILAERAAKSVDQEVLQEHNITLETCERETNRRADDFGEFTWFQRVMEAIADNRKIDDCDKAVLPDLWSEVYCWSGK